MRMFPLGDNVIDVMFIRLSNGNVSILALTYTKHRISSPVTSTKHRISSEMTGLLQISPKFMSSQTDKKTPNFDNFVIR